MEGADVQSLRKELKALLRKKRATELAQRRQHVLPSVDLQMRAVVVFLLSGSAELACSWAKQEQHTRPWHTFRLHVAVSAALVAAWAGQWGSHALVLAAIQNLQHPWRAAADVFLMESLLAERITQMSASGLAMSSACAWSAYMRYWSHRPKTLQQQAWLTELDNKPCKRAKYLWRFRKRWSLHFGVPKPRPGLSMTLLRDRVFSTKYMRQVILN